MSKVTFIVTFRVEDDEEIKKKFIESLQCAPLRIVKELPDTSELYETDKEYRKLYQAYKKAKQNYYNYSNEKLK
tara:strand:+ start:635 stop:856 length:222 start_codon:yes stop_codon:yes gene_type:complete